MTVAGSTPTSKEPQTGHELQLISDGEGLTVIGKASEVERFLVSQGLDKAPSKDLGRQLQPVLRTAAGLTQQGAKFAADSGRWVKLTADSADKVAKFGLMPTKTPNVSHAMIGDPGSVQSWIQIVTGPASFATNPAVLAGAAGVMAQIAMQQMMDEITDYLAAIDEKVDDILRAQKDSVFADMIGVDLMIEEAMTVREGVGRVSEVTWSKVQGTAATIARTQAYAIRQLDALAEKLERKSDMGELANSAREAEAKVQEWLAILARCFQLQDGIAVLELDRVLDAAPDELNQHRVALRLAREKRLQLIARSTVQLLTRMKAAADRANTEVLIHPIASPAVVRSNNVVAAGVVGFQERLGLTAESQSMDARLWTAAAGDAWNAAVKVGADGVDAAGRFGARTVQAFQSVDRDGDGVPEKPRALSAVENAGATVSGAAASAAKATAGAAGAAAEAATGAAANVADAGASVAGAIASWLRRKPSEPDTLTGAEAGRRRIDVVGAVIVDDSLVYCTKRGQGSLEGHWEFPGGKLEPGESPASALTREIHEELGCTIEVGDKVVTTEHEYDFAVVVLTTFYCRLVDGEPILSEHTDSTWLPPGELANLNWAPADWPAVRQIQSDLG